MLSVVKLCGTSKILKSEFIYLSPAIGLLTHLSPSLIANLRVCPIQKKLLESLDLTSSIELAKEFYYQRVDSVDNRRYGPINITKSRSKASYWLTPSTLGCLVGLSLSEQSLKVKKICIIITICLINYYLILFMILYNRIS